MPVVPWTGQMTLKGRTKDANHPQDRNQPLQNGCLEMIFVHRS